MQVKSTAIETAAKLQAVPIPDSITVVPMTTKTITAFVEHSSEWSTTDSLTPVGKNHRSKESANVPFDVNNNWHKGSYQSHQHKGITLFNQREHTSRRILRSQSRAIKVHQARYRVIFTMTPERELGLSTYLNELLQTSTPEQQNNAFWLPTHKNLGKNEDNAPIQTRIVKKLTELKENSTGNAESRRKILEPVDWTDTRLTEAEKQAKENFLVEYYDIFARHRMDLGMNTEFKVKQTPPKNDKAAYSQNLPMPIDLKEHLIVELALVHKYGIITVLPSPKYASPIFAQGKANGKLRLLVDIRKINTLNTDKNTNSNLTVTTLSNVAQHLTKKHLFCNIECYQVYHC